MEFVMNYIVEIFVVGISLLSAIVIKAVQKYGLVLTNTIRSKAESKEVKELSKRVEELVELAEIQAVLNMSNKIVPDEAKEKYKKVLEKYADPSTIKETIEEYIEDKLKL